MANRGYYDRYIRFKGGGGYRIVPFIEIPRSETDLLIQFDRSTMRLDNLSYKYYSSPDYAWLIMLANPELCSLEYIIPDGSLMIIAYPLDLDLSLYERNISNLFY